jgi:hypothetical protein
MAWRVYTRDENVRPAMEGYSREFDSKDAAWIQRATISSFRTPKSCSLRVPMESESNWRILRHGAVRERRPLDWRTGQQKSGASMGAASVNPGWSTGMACPGAFAGRSGCAGACPRPVCETFAIRSRDMPGCAPGYRDVPAVEAACPAHRVPRRQGVGFGGQNPVAAPCQNWHTRLAPARYHPSLFLVKGSNDDVDHPDCCPIAIIDGHRTFLRRQGPRISAGTCGECARATGRALPFGGHPADDGASKQDIYAAMNLYRNCFKHLGKTEEQRQEDQRTFDQFDDTKNDYLLYICAEDYVRLRGAMPIPHANISLLVLCLPCPSAAFSIPRAEIPGPVPRHSRHDPCSTEAGSGRLHRTFLRRSRATGSS